MSRTKDQMIDNGMFPQWMLWGERLMEKDQVEEQEQEQEQEGKKENNMKSQIEKKLPPYGRFLMVYNSLNHAEKNYIRHGDDERANDIRKRIKEFKKYRTESEASELVAILEKIKSQRKENE